MMQAQARRAVSVNVGTTIDAAIEAAAQRASVETLRAEAPLVPRPRRLSTRTLLWLLAGLLVTVGWDRAIWLLVSSGGAARFEWLETVQPWASLVLPVKYYGHIVVWVVVALAMVMSTWTKSDTSRVMVGVRRGVFVLLSALAGGGLAEGVKLLTRRMRPEASDGFYAFRSLAGEWWSTSGLGLASSHAAVAFAGALALGLILPRIRRALFALAIACAMERVLAGAHYPSDVYVGAGCGFLGVWAVYWLDARNNRGVGIDGRPTGLLRANAVPRPA